MIGKKDFDALKELVCSLSCTNALSLLAQRFPKGLTFSTSFSNEDQVIIDLLAGQRPEIAVFTLDTGRLFPETYSVWSRTNERYGCSVKAYFPQAALLEAYLNEQGPNGFYRSPEERKSCCSIRKVEPLKRALQGKSVWITGLRAEHSANRQQLEVLEWDEANAIIKYNPLLHWTTEEVADYIHRYSLPYNVLSDRGFVSIGCQPCTRAIEPGEDFRAGRWWWEDANKKECGLHK